MRQSNSKNKLCLIMMLALGIMSFYSGTVKADDVLQFRGPERTGIYNETGLLKQWPEEGPKLLTQITGLGEGYSSPAISNGIIYITGVTKNLEYLYAFDHEGNLKWKTQYGRAARSYPGSRSTPTVTDNFIYLTSGSGEVVCFNKADGSIKWSVHAIDKFQGKYGRWQIAESILLVGGKVIFTPGGNKTTMVALDSQTGETIWMSESLGGSLGYASPILVKRGEKQLIITITDKYMIGVNAENGNLEWKVDYLAYSKDAVYKGINAPSPIYHNGRVFFTSGYNQTPVMLNISEDGSSAEVAWVNNDLDNHHGNVVLVDGYIYGSNWLNNQSGNWLCVDWNTGKTIYDAEWYTKGSIIYADGMLYCYEEKSGHVGLVKATPEKFDLVSSFQITEGDGPYWAHPVISNQKLYMRHGDILNIYDINAKDYNVNAQEKDNDQNDTQGQ